ncbi:MAG: type III pantothenate kinase [Armatimonadota bacterium]
MLLAIDVGNTNLHFGVYHGDRLLDTWRVKTDRERTGDELAALLLPLLAHAGIAFDAIGACAVSNVVPPLAPSIRHFARRYLKPEAEFVGETLRPKVPIRYTPAAAVGADRLVDAVAVLRHYGAPAVVVDFGTATTFDAISAEGEYLGGAIAPGVGISMDALFRAAAHLPRIELVRPRSVVGGNTLESMQSGAYFGFVGQVEGMVRRMKQELGPETRIIATGGLAELISPDTDCIDHVDPNLTLEGLRLTWEEAHLSRDEG